MTISRRQIIVGAAAAAAGAAVPAAAVNDDLVFMTKGLDVAMGFDHATAPEGPVDWTKMIADAKQASQAALAGVPADAQWVYFVDQDGRLITGHVEIVSFDDDPVRHHEGREDPAEYA